LLTSNFIQVAQELQPSTFAESTVSIIGGNTPFLTSNYEKQFYSNSFNFRNSIGKTFSIAYIAFQTGNLTPDEKYKKAVYIGVQPQVDQEIYITLFVSSIVQSQRH
jgi:hypothetical protein